jgi:hypothetical protein
LFKPAGGTKRRRLREHLIPDTFIGEWNQDSDKCGTDLSDTRLRIGPDWLHFYESDAKVLRVRILDSRSISVDASFSGEGSTWSDSVNMVLSQSGNDLTIGGFTRKRCS